MLQDSQRELVGRPSLVRRTPQPPYTYPGIDILTGMVKSLNKSRILALSSSQIHSPPLGSQDIYLTRLFGLELLRSALRRDA